MRISVKWNILSGLGVASHAVLRAIERNKVYLRMSAEELRRGAETGVDRRGISD
jgi:predicted thioesterase